MNYSASNAGRPPDSKAVLFCFECSHESPLEGDWLVEQGDDCEVYSCPECGTTITVRPRESPSRATDTDGRTCYCIGD